MIATNLPHPTLRNSTPAGIVLMLTACKRQTRISRHCSQHSVKPTTQTLAEPAGDLPWKSESNRSKRGTEPTAVVSPHITPFLSCYQDVLKVSVQETTQLLSLCPRNTIPRLLLKCTQEFGTGDCHHSQGVMPRDLPCSLPKEVIDTG